jgi:salicylate hydroxylase
LRERIVGDGKPRVSGHIAYRAVLPIGEVEEEYRPSSVVLWAGPKTHLVHYPLRRGELFNLVAVFHSDRYEEGWNVFGDTEELDLRFKNAHPTVKLLLAKINQWKMWVLCDREPVRSWTQGRATLVGDAAHPMLQYLAQGAGMAFEDAVVLAHHVAAAGDDYAAAFRAYNEARYLRTGPRPALCAPLWRFLPRRGRAGRIAQRAAEARARQEARRRHGLALRRNYRLTPPAAMAQ